MRFLQSLWAIPLCIAVVYVFARGLLGILYEFSNFMVKILNGES